MEKKISSKQLTANRQNAQLGGVKTDAGKAIVKFNALKHGILSKEIILKDESKRVFNEHTEKLKQTLQPANEIEMFLVDKIITDSWRLKRAMKIETEMMQNDFDKQVSQFDPEEKKNLGSAITYNLNHYNTYGKFTRYITTIERGFYRALHELQRLQAQRRGQDVPLPVIIDVNIQKEE